MRYYGCACFSLVFNIYNLTHVEWPNQLGDFFISFNGMYGIKRNGYSTNRVVRTENVQKTNTTRGLGYFAKRIQYVPFVSSVSH